MTFGICHLTCAPVRRHPDLTSEMVSQMLFGDVFEVLDTRGVFRRVRLSFDGYEGWIDGRQTVELSSEEAGRWTRDDCPMATESAMAISDDGRALWIPPASTLAGLSAGRFHLCGQRYEWKGLAATARRPISGRELIRFALAYENAPYQWGGRSPWGIDCSGLVQSIYRVFGVRLPRDTDRQSACGEPVQRDDARLGDLVFLRSALDGSAHVGLMLKTGILHASAFVRLDQLVPEGIVDRQTGALSHTTSTIRRVAEVID